MDRWTAIVFYPDIDPRSSLGHGKTRPSLLEFLVHPYLLLVSFLFLILPVSFLFSEHDMIVVAVVGVPVALVLSGVEPRWGGAALGAWKDGSGRKTNREEEEGMDGL